MDKKRFEQFVDEAMRQLPRELSRRISNLAVHVQWKPTAEQLERWDIPPDVELLGFYEGIPLTERTSNYGLVAPDVIYIFQESIEAMCATEDAVRVQARRTVFHEIAHHFGIDDERLEELGAE